MEESRRRPLKSTSTMADVPKPPDTTYRQQPKQEASSKTNDHDHHHHDGITIARQQARISIHPTRPQQGNSTGRGRFFKQFERGHGPTHHIGSMDRQPGSSIGGRMGETKDWSNSPDKLNEETTTHPTSKPFSRGDNYFSQPGGESTKPNSTPSKPSYNQDTFIGGGDTKQKTQKEMTTNEAGDPREMTENLKKTTSQNPGIQETNKYYYLVTATKQPTKKSSRCSITTKHQKSIGAVPTQYYNSKTMRRQRRGSKQRKKGGKQEITRSRLKCIIPYSMTFTTYPLQTRLTNITTPTTKPTRKKRRHNQTVFK